MNLLGEVFCGCAETQIDGVRFPASATGSRHNFSQTRDSLGALRKT